jgi:hypothetical protein
LSAFKSVILIIATWLGSNLSWAALRPLVLEFLKSTFVKTILLKMFGSAISGGYKAWIAKLIVEYAYEELAEPIVKLVFRRAGYLYNKVEGKIIIEKIKEARDENNSEKYNSAVDVIFK